MSSDHKTNKRRGVMVRAAGLLSVAVIAILLAACGLTMAFGLYDVSKVLFISIVVLLIAINIYLKSKS